MLKIKNDVDLKELEKFGYKKDDGYYRKYEKGYRVQIHDYYKNILVYKYRENSDWGDFIGHLKEEDEEIKPYIQDLIKADLVEKNTRLKVNDMIRFGTIESVCVNNLNRMVEKVNIISEHNNWYMRKITEIKKVSD